MDVPGQLRVLFEGAPELDGPEDRDRRLARGISLGLPVFLARPPPSTRVCLLNLNRERSSDPAGLPIVNTTHHPPISHRSSITLSLPCLPGNPNRIRLRHLLLIYPFRHVRNAPVKTMLSAYRKSRKYIFSTLSLTPPPQTVYLRNM